jgi:hypothetical protein
LWFETNKIIWTKDDRPVRDDLNSVSVKWGFGHDISSYNTTEYQIPDDGVIELKVRIIYDFNWHFVTKNLETI